MASDSELAGVEALATRVKQLLWVVLDSVPSELVPWSLTLVRLLQAADTFPRGGLYDGYYAAQAALRYEVFWLPLAGRAQRSSRGHVLVPPLDVAMAWLMHRCLAPGTYAADCEALLGRVLDPSPAQAFRFAGSHAYTQCELHEEREAWASREVWDAAYVHGAGSFDIHSAASTPAPGSEAPSPRPELGPAPLRNGGGGSWTGGRRVGRGSRGGSSNGSDGGFGGSVKVAAPGAAASAAGSRDGSGGGSSGGSRLQSQYWPPAPRGSRRDLTKLVPLVHADTSSIVGSGGTASVALLGRGRLAGQLAGRMGELCPLLHSLLRPAFLDPDVLAQAVQRYCRFLMLQGMHPSVPMVPTTDIALMWLAHMALPSAYRETCRRLLGRVVVPAPGALRLDDSGPEFGETRRLYEHHFGEVYDPPITRAVPMSTPHPLLSSPLAPFLPSFEVIPTGAAVVLAAAYFDADTGLASPVSQQVRQQMRYDKGTGEYVNGGVDPGAGAGLNRCGAHALYLAYLLRRGANRRHRSLLGLVLGQAHRRRAAVKYVANKASGFRDFLHLPHSDCHPYWRKLRLRPVDPETIPSGAVTPTDDGSEHYQEDAVQQVGEDELYGTGDSDDGDDDDGGGRARIRQLGEDQERQHAAVRQALARAAAAAATAASAAAAAAPSQTGASGEGGGGGGGFLTPVGVSRRNSFMDPTGGTSPVPQPAPMSVSSGGSSRAGDGEAVLPPGQQRRRPHIAAAASTAPNRGTGVKERQRTKRISLIVPLPTLPYTMLTFEAAGSESTPSHMSSGRESAAGGASDRLSLVNRTSAGVPYAKPYESPTITAHGMAPPTAAAATGAAAVLVAPPDEPPVDLAAGLQAAAAAAKAPLKPWAAPRSTAPQQTGGEPWPFVMEGVAGSDSGAMPSPPQRRPSIERRRGQAADGSDEWAYNNPYYVDPALGIPPLSPLSPLSPLGQTPPPASAALLAEAEARNKAQGAAASGDALPSPPPPPHPSARGFGGEVWAVRVSRPEDATAGADGGDPEGGEAAGGEGGGGGGGSASLRLRHLRSGGFLAEEGGVPAAPGSLYGSCHGSYSSLKDAAGEEKGESGSAAAAAAGVGVLQVRRGGGGGSGEERAASAGSSDSEEVFCTPSAAFAATVTTPFTPVRADGGTVGAGGDGGGGGREEISAAAVAATAAATLTFPSTSVSTPPAKGSGGGFAFAAAGAVGATSGEGGGLYTSGGGSYAGAGYGSPFSRVSATSATGTSRLARVTTAGPMPTPTQSLPPPPAAVTASTPGLTRGGSAITPSRSSGLPPRPAPSAASASATVTAATPKRASGMYGPADVSYMGGLGGVASLVTRGESSPQFSMSLRERYTGSSAVTGGVRPSGSGTVGGAGSGSAGEGSSSAGFSTPGVSSSGASFVSAVSGRSSGGRGSGPGAAGRDSGGGGGGSLAPVAGV